MQKSQCSRWSRSEKVYLLVGAITLLSGAIFFNFPEVTEAVYYNGIYRFVRVVYDYSLALLPFPMFHAFLLAALLLLVYIIFRIIEIISSEESLVDKLCRFVKGSLSLLSVILFLFYFLWGFNYAREPFDERLNLPIVEIDSMVVKNEARQVTVELNRLRAIIGDKPIDKSDIREDIEPHIRSLQESFMSAQGEVFFGKGRVRQLQPEGIFLRFSTAGMYMPFAMEGQVDAGLHPLQDPFVIAHEMGHVYGYGEESVCNLIGYLVCMQSEDIIVQYSGILGYWRYLISNVRRISKQAYEEIWNMTDERVLKDLEDIQTQMRKFPDILPDLRDKIYDSYLKANKISGGLQNYSEVIELNIRWQAREHNEQD